MRETRIASLRTAFFSGLILLSPIAVTWMVFSWLVDNLGGKIRPIVFPDSMLAHPTLQFAWNVATMMIVLLLITGLGWLSRYVLGQFFAGLTEKVIQSIPGINAIYNTVKQVVDTFGSQNKNMFSKVVMIEFPRKGVWTLAFLTSKQRGEPQAQLPGEHWTVFVPTSPNPTGGYVLMLPREEIIELEMSVGDGMKMVISGGAVLPPVPGTPPGVGGQGI
jgi:uncharacterized membrane protein